MGLIFSGMICVHLTQGTFRFYHMVNHLCHPHFKPQGKDVLGKVKDSMKGKKRKESDITFFPLPCPIFLILKIFHKDVGHMHYVVVDSEDMQNHRLQSTL